MTERTPDQSDAAWLRAHADQVDAISSAKIAQSDAARFRAIADRLDAAAAVRAQPKAEGAGAPAATDRSDAAWLNAVAEGIDQDLGWPFREPWHVAAGHLRAIADRLDAAGTVRASAIRATDSAWGLALVNAEYPDGFDRSRIAQAVTEEYLRQRECGEAVTNEDLRRGATLGGAFDFLREAHPEPPTGAPEPSAWSPGKIGERYESETGSLYCLVGKHLFRPREDGYWTRDDGSLCCTPCLTRRQHAEGVVVRLRKAEAERDAALIAADDKRHSLAQEIAGCLRSRGAKWVPDTRERSYDLIPALGQFLDAAVARAEAAEAQVAALTAERDRLNVLEGITGLLESICAAWSIRVAARGGVVADED